MSADKVAFQIISGAPYTTLPWLVCSETVVSILFSFFAASRWLKLRKTVLEVSPNHQKRFKVVSNLALFVTQLCIVVKSTIGTSTLDLDALILEIFHSVAFMFLLVLSPREHCRTISPSNLLVIFLSFRIATDAFGISTSPDQRFISLILVRTLIQVVSLVLESSSKDRISHQFDQDLAPEELVGPWNRATFWWVNSLLFGVKRFIRCLETLPPGPSQLDSSTIRQKMLLIWNTRTRPEHPLTLVLCLAHCLLPQFWAVFPTRFLLIVCRYAQPFLISRILRMLATNGFTAKSSPVAYTIIAASIITYIGQAIISTKYQHQLNRLRVKTRAALVALIYDKVLTSPTGAQKNYQAITLMSTDADSLGSSSDMFHETWAQTLEIIVGMTLLAQQIGWLSLLPLPFIFVCSRMSRYVARNLRPKQQEWNEVTQSRISQTIVMLNSIKIIRMLGLTQTIQDQITRLRQTEIEKSKSLRWVAVFANVSANALGILTPMITLIVVALVGGIQLDAEIAFTTLAILIMVTHPANMIMTIVPRAIASLASFERIQQFLIEDILQDTRLLVENQNDVGYDLPIAIQFNNVELRTSTEAKPILQDINLSITRGSVVVCFGTTGSGKTILASMISGGIAPTKGSTSVLSKRVALCTQVPWLVGASVREMIEGPTEKPCPRDDAWYRTVLEACSLHDGILLQSADQTDAQTQYSKLSGGQRQRIALARAIYQRCDILVLDDPFCSLDQGTRQRVIHNLFGPSGLLKKLGTTIFKTTSRVEECAFADRLVLLRQGRIEFNGPSEDLMLMSPPDSVINADQTETAYTKKPLHTTAEVATSTKASNIVIQTAEVDTDRLPGDFAVYGYYLGSIGIRNIVFLLACTAMYSCFSIFPHYWLKWWIEAGAASNSFYVLGYILLSVIAWLSTSGTLWVNFIKLAPRSGSLLHAGLLQVVLEAPMSYFFVNDAGTVLNRFSQDIQLIDRDLPSALAALCTQVFKLAMQCILLVLSQKLLLLTLPIYCLFIYAVQKVYLRASREVRFLELESRSAVYTSFLQTIDGLATIRSFQWQEAFTQINTQALETSQRAFYFFLCLQRWLNVSLDLAVAAIAVIVIAIAVLFAKEESATDVGIALNMVLIANTTLLRLVESWTSFEVSIGAVARLKDMQDHVPNEEIMAAEVMAPETWPNAGGLVLKDVKVCYIAQTVALDKFNLHVKPGQRVFICGQTGSTHGTSGKSTLFMTLLRICQVQQGSIQIDGVEISRASPSYIRERCFVVVPQDHFHQSEMTLRENLDPGSDHSDVQIMAALQKLHLGSHFLDPACESDADSLEEAFSRPLSSFPPLSAGQLQLLNLARAVLKAQSSARQGRKPIVLLDEPASSLDPQYEELISKTVEKEFTDKGHTVLMITHNVKDLEERARVGVDMIVEIDKGRVRRAMM